MHGMKSPADSRAGSWVYWDFVTIHEGNTSASIAGEAHEPMVADIAAKRIEADGAY
jgi:hypothetical protein